MIREIVMNVEFIQEEAFSCKFSEDSTLEVDFGEIYSPPTYEGETVIEPNQSIQTLQTAGRVLLTNITVNPMPSNYGLITWNGSTLTVS